MAGTHLLDDFVLAPTQGSAGKELFPIGLWLIHSNFFTIDFYMVFGTGLMVNLSTYSNQQILQCSIAFHPPYSRCHGNLPPPHNQLLIQMDNMHFKHDSIYFSTDAAK